MTIKYIAMRAIILLFLSNALFAQVHNPQFELWDLHNGREKPAEWYCPNLCSSPACGPCDKIQEGANNYAVRVHNVMPCVSSDNQAKSRAAGFIRDFFNATSNHFKISFDLTIDSIDVPAEFVFTLAGGGSTLVWTTSAIQSQRIEHVITLDQDVDSLFIQFESVGYLKQNSLHECDLGYISAIVDNIETEDIVSSHTLSSKNFHVYPNPFSDNITIGGILNEASWTLYELTGQIMLRGNSVELQGLHTLQKGLYVLEIREGKNMYFEKVVKE